jgi:hypothetical protein
MVLGEERSRVWFLAANAIGTGVKKAGESSPETPARISQLA